MSVLFVVRHGQASFFEANYDQLSPLGREQSRLLGEYWARRGARFDEAYTGPRQRQIDTAQAIAEVYRQTGLTWPRIEVLDEFDEYQAEAVLKQSLPMLVETDARVRELYRDVERATDQAQTLKAFQRVYELVIGSWARGELDLADIEPWSDFCARVHRGIDRLTQGDARGRRVVLVTSGGPVGVTLQRALGISSQRTLEMAWMVRNAAFSEYVFTKDRFTLSQFNAIAHLERPELWTYR
jgi:broad specificity phosphatase PhoE